MDRLFEWLAATFCMLPFLADVILQLKTKKGFIPPVFGATFAAGFFFGALAHATGRGAGVPLVFYIAGTVVAFWSFVLKAEKSEEKKDEALYGGNADKRDGKDNKPQAENGKNESTGRAA